MIRDAALREEVTLFATHYATDIGSGADSGYGSGSGDSPVTSRYGDPILVEGDGVVVRASVKPIKEAEYVNGMDRTTNYFRVIVRPDVTDLVNLDTLTRVEYLGVSYDLFGSPQPFPYRNGVHHLTFMLEGFTGG